MKAINAYSLVRFSTNRQFWNDSKTRQKDVARAECIKRGWEYDAKLCITDLKGQSAFRGKNFDAKRALGAFILAAKENRLLPNPWLIVENQDRFSRDILDNADSHLWSLVKSGVNVLIASSGLELRKGDENDIAKRAIVLFEFDRAHKESARKSESVTKAFKTKYNDVKAGKLIDFGPWAPKWFDFVGPKYGEGKYIRNDKFQTIRKIVEWYLAGASMFAIARKLNEAKTPTLLYSKHWSQNLISSILTSELLIGTLNIKGLKVANYFPAIVSETEWHSIANLLRENTIRKGGQSPKDYVANLFRNRVKCAHCGGTVNVTSAWTKKTRIRRSYFQCSEARTHACKASGLLNVKLVEQDFFINFLGTTPGTLVRNANDAFTKEINSLKAEIVTLELKLKQCQADYEEQPSKTLAGILASTESKLSELQGELTTFEQKRTARLAAPSVMRDVKEMLSGDSNRELNKVVNHVKHSLTLPEHRAKLLLLLPSLVQGLTIDLTKGAYAVRQGDKLSEYRVLAK